MATGFVARFLLPLVRGGRVVLGRPLSRRAVEALSRTVEREGPSDAREDAQALAVARREALTVIVSAPPLPAMDEATWRLGAAVHNLLVLDHPRLATGPGSEERIARVAEIARALAALGPPDTLNEALGRHSVVARLPDLVRPDTTVRTHLSRLSYVGRRPPPRVLALPRLRGVRVETVRKNWLRDIGVPPAARPAFLALTEASPLGEALDPLRLDPPFAWGRALSILRFAPLCRVVAGRLVATGLPRVGDVLAEALYRFASAQDETWSIRATPARLAFAVQFMAHLAWLDHLFASAHRPVAATAGTAGRDLALLLATARGRRPDLVFPADVSPMSAVGLGFWRYLDVMFQQHGVAKNPRRAVAEDLIAAAAPPATPQLAGAPPAGDAV